MMNILKMFSKDIKEYEKVKRKSKRMPVWALIVTDILLTAVSLSIFGLFFYVMPQKKNDGTVVATADDLKNNLASNDGNKISHEPSGSQNKPENGTSDSIKRGPGAKSSPGDEKGPGGRNTGNTNTTNIESKPADSSLDLTNKVITDVGSYSDDNINIKINKIETGSNKDKVTYYVADVNVSNLSYLKTAFAQGEYGKNIKDNITKISGDNDAILAISGDFYGNSEDGVVIRNGILYRADVNDADICVLFTDGKMKTYSPSEFDADEVINEGAWQAWTFGPALLDGNGKILSSFNTTSYLNNINPRCAIGYISEGHYKFIVVDGRNEGYSKGVNLSELAQIMSDEGCKTAYNLDGGKSAAMLFNGEFINEPVDGGREISDIIYVCN